MPTRAEGVSESCFDWCWIAIHFVPLPASDPRSFWWNILTLIHQIAVIMEGVVSRQILRYTYVNMRTRRAGAKDTHLKKDWSFGMGLLSHSFCRAWDQIFLRFMRFYKNHEPHSSGADIHMNMCMNIYMNIKYDDNIRPCYMYIRIFTCVIYMWVYCNLWWWLLLVK